MAASLGQLITVRSQLAEEVLRYLEVEARRASELPYYYPEHLRTHADGTTGFERVRQLVAVRRHRREAEQASSAGPHPYEPRYARPEQDYREFFRAEEQEAERPVPWDDQAGEQFQRAIILGDPGYGKTWLLRFEQARLVRQAARQLQDQTIALDALVLPILGRLPEIAARLADLAHFPEVVTGKKDALEEVLVAVTRRHRSEAFAEFVRDRLRTGRCVILLDAWDEVPDSGDGGELRQPLFRAIREFAGRYAQPGPGPRFLLTSRGREYRDPPLSEANELVLLAFETEQMEAMVAVWFSGPLAGHRDRILSLLRGNSPVRGLARIPLMLALMCKTWQEELTRGQRGEAPRALSLTDSRVELFKACLEGLLGKWPRDDQKVSASQIALDKIPAKLALLQYVAFGLMVQGKVREFEESDLQEAVGGFLDCLEPRHPLERKSTDELSAEFKRAGLVSAVILRANASLVFFHRIFQEYLAARHLIERVHPTGGSERAKYPQTRLATEAFPARLVKLARANPAHWWEVALLAGAELKRRSEGRVWEFIEALCPEESPPREESDWALVWLAGQMVLDTDLGIANPASKEENILKRIKTGLGRLLDEGRLAVPERAQAGVVLGRLGDPRPGVGLIKEGPGKGLPELDWVPIKPGIFRMGGEREFEGGGEYECEVLKERPYRMSRYPVTVAQFEAFVRAGGYEEGGRRGWTEAGRAWRVEEGITGPAGYREPFQTPNHPVVGVSWFEAIAFCRWLTARLRELPVGHPQRLAPDERITLPSEAEWERAARGRTGKVYAWGNEATEMGERCNCEESGLGATCAVGMFADNRSEEGVQDLTGNVWEWTRSLWGENLGTATYAYPYNPDDGREKVEAPAAIGRVLRGGSWIAYDPGNLRAANRDRFQPDFRYYDIGFRCVVVGSGPEAG